MKHRIPRSLAAAIGVVATLLALALGAAPAHAGPQHHGTDPSGYCASNSSLITTRSIEPEIGGPVGEVQIFYSWNCQTNWIQVPANNAGGATIKNIRVSGGTWLPSEVDYGYGMSYSMQVYAPGTTCIDIYVALKYPSGAHYGETYNPAGNYLTIC